MSRLSGTTVLITGAANGIGAETAARLVAAGARVSLLDRDERVVERAASLGPGAMATIAEVTDLSALESVVGTTVERFGGLDAVIVNAAIERFGAVEDMDPAAFDEVVAVDLGGAWRTARAGLPELLRSRGYLLFVTSLAAVSGGPRNAAYNAAKAGVVSLAKTLRVEVAARGVDVGVLYLGPVDTETGRAAMADPVMAPVLARLPRAMLRPAPVGRVADAIVHAIDRRSERIVLPGSGRMAVLFPELAQWFVQGRLASVGADDPMGSAVDHPEDPS